jgi:DNA processing protein
MADSSEPLEEARAWLRLVCTPGVSSAMARALLTQIGLPQAVLSAGLGAVSKVVGKDAALKLTSELQAEDRQRIDAALAWLEQGAGFLVTLADADYPKQLLNIADPPVLLYARGNRALLGRDAVAIVGSRNPTPQGERNAEDFARALSQAGLAVVSGLALGVDAAAHRGGLAGEGSTIAVTGTGIDRIYPSRNKELAHDIAERGLILSEYAFGTPPLKENFPRRNRIISGLSHGVLVVEAAVQSGSLITARMAGEQGREVLAIPGSIHSPQSRGCHALIKQGAKLVESAEDVLEELRQQARRTRVSADVDRDEEEGDNPLPAGPLGKLLAAMGYEPIDIDELCRRTGDDAATLAAQLLDLELEGRVGRLPGGMFQRIERA